MSSTGRNRSGQDPNSPGWKLVDSHWLWWDGKQYTTEWDGTSYVPLSTAPGPVGRGPRAPRPRASVAARSTMIGVVVLGCMVLWWGWTRTEERQCELSNFTYTETSGLWLPWLVLLVLASLGMVVSKRAAPGVRWIKELATIGLVASLVTFPGFVACAGAMNCAM